MCVYVLIFAMSVQCAWEYVRMRETREDAAVLLMLHVCTCGDGRDK